MVVMSALQCSRVALRCAVRLNRGLCTNSTTSFGFLEVTEEEKARKVQGVFRQVAGYYDQMNDVMSFGLHRLWKDWLVQQLAPPPGSRVLDVAGGTGDVALRLAEYVGRGGEKGGCVEVTVVDTSVEMLQEGMKKPDSSGVSWLQGDAMALPFPNNSFDAYTIVFGIRNVPNISQVLMEAERVLVPGGRFMCMEFCPLENPYLLRLYDVYSFEVIPVLGELVAADRESYQYLVESIRQFPSPGAFANLMGSVGLRNVHYQTLGLGVAAVHSAFKLFHLQT